MLRGIKFIKKASLLAMFLFSTIYLVTTLYTLFYKTHFRIKNQNNSLSGVRTIVISSNILVEKNSTFNSVNNTQTENTLNKEATKNVVNKMLQGNQKINSLTRNMLMNKHLYNNLLSEFHKSNRSLINDGLSKILVKGISVVENKEDKSTNFVSINQMTENNMLKNKIKIAVLVPSTTRSLKNPKIENLSLFSVFIKSFFKTMEEAYDYTVYVGIDQGDFLEAHQTNLREISTIIKVVIVKHGSFNSAVNNIAKQAYQDNMTYFVRVNDDTLFVSKNWTTVGISALNKFNPPNIGVVGPKCNQGNTHILTHDMVHRTHMDIFGYYYPPEFQYWYMDDWITNVYKPDRSRKLTKWEVRHKMIHGTRYKVNHLTRKRLNGMKNDKRIIQRYIKHFFPYFSLNF